MTTTKTGVQSHIAALTLLGELLTIVGPVGVLGLWLYQQTEVEQSASELRKIASARSVYQTYQSNNALFNATNEVLGQNEKASERLRNYQVYNYELGLAALEDVLSPPEKRRIPEPTAAYGPATFQSKMEQTQQRLELLQDRVNEKEAAIRAAAAAAQKTYFWIFVVLSFLSILGAIGKTVQKLSSGDRP
jgi:hypothetical protein